MDFQFPQPCLRFSLPLQTPQSSDQLSFQNGDISQGVIVGLSWALAHIGGSDDVNLVTQVVKGEQPVEEHQQPVRQGQVVLGTFADLFQLPHHVVGKVAHGACGKRRQPLQRGGTVLAQ